MFHSCQLRHQQQPQSIQETKKQKEVRLLFQWYNEFMKNVLNTERLKLRKLQESDLEDIFEWARDPEVTRYVTWNPHESIEVTRTVLDLWLREYDDPDCYRYGIELKETGKLIGMIDVVGYREGVPETGYILNRRYWNRGYMSEALGAFRDHLLENFDELFIRAACDNHASNAVIRKNGFEFVGTEMTVKNGEPVMINKYRYLKQGGTAHEEGN